MASQVNRNIAGTVIGLSMALLSGGIANSTDMTTPDPLSSSVTTRSAPPGVRRAVNRLLAQITMRDEPLRRGYSRAKFPHWSDLNGDGCDTREQVLVDESEAGTISRCEVIDGEWRSIYDDKVFSAPTGLDIDHLVALGEAWDSGASKWETERRQRYANDLDYDDALIAVSAASNRSKSDKDPTEWKPPNKVVWCRYATAWVTAKIRWDLAADQAEIQALRSMFQTCRSRPPTSIEKAE